MQETFYPILRHAVAKEPSPLHTFGLTWMYQFVDAPLVDVGSIAITTPTHALGTFRLVMSTLLSPHPNASGLALPPVRSLLEAASWLHALHFAVQSAVATFNKPAVTGVTALYMHAKPPNTIPRPRNPKQS
jgi:hypothetical protein